MSAGSTGTLLGVWAHPDDEAYLSSGLMAATRRRGERVVVVTATAGEHGTGDPERWPPPRLAARRRRELLSSLAVAGVVEHRFLGYPDGGCSGYEAAPQIAEIIAEVRPDTIVTFGPEGMTGHPDHQAVSAWTTAAWRATGATSRLWYATLTAAFHHEWSALNDDVGLWTYGAPPCTEADDLTHVVELDGIELDRKFAALQAHASQTTDLIELVGEATFRSWWRTEAFVDALAYVTPPLIGASS